MMTFPSFSAVKPLVKPVLLPYLIILLVMAALHRPLVQYAMDFPVYHFALPLTFIIIQALWYVWSGRLSEFWQPLIVYAVPVAAQYIGLSISGFRFSSGTWETANGFGKFAALLLDSSLTAMIVSLALLPVAYLWRKRRPLPTKLDEKEE